MLIAGAGSHAKDLLIVLAEQDTNTLVFFDDINHDKNTFLNTFKVIHTIDELQERFLSDNRFVVATGNARVRKLLFQKLSESGGEPVSVISGTAVTGSYDVSLGKGLNIMPFCFISNSVRIGDGTLINTRASVHHDVEVGKFCDIGPSSTLLGGVKIGDQTDIGAGAVILPTIRIGSNCIVGAGSVVTRNIPDNSLIYGSPARIIKEL